MAKKRMKKKRNRNWNLIWMLAKTDFKLRYHGSILGYFWAILKPLLIFLILNFVFSQAFARGAGIEHYSLRLITGIIVWSFFSEGTVAGLTSILNKANIVSKIYFPRWIVVVASTLNSLLVFMMNLLVLVGFYAFYQKAPTFSAIFMAFLYIIGIYLLILSFSFIASFLYLKYRDMVQVWDVILQGLFYASPIIYPLTLLPEKYHKILLSNPVGMLIHYTKIVLIDNRFPDLKNNLIAFGLLIILFVFSVMFFNKVSKKVAENI